MAHWALVERFRQACECDERVMAAFLGGSLADGRADEHSDLDLYVVAREDACAELVGGRQAFVAAFGSPVFVDVTPNFAGLGFDMLHFVLADGRSGEVAIAHPRSFRETHGGPHRILVDKTGLLDGVEFPRRSRSKQETQAAAGRALGWFWLHALGLAKALARGRLWVAHWQLEQLRSLLREILAAAEPTPEIGRDAERELAGSLVALDRDALLAAALRLVGVYRSVAPTAARNCGLEVPESLARVALAKLQGGAAAAPV